MRVLITGANRGIGRAIAEALAGRGARMALAVRDTTTLQPLLAAAPGSVIVPVDLRERMFTSSLVARAVGALGGLDVLINCAGIVDYSPIAELSDESLRDQFEINFFAAATLAQHAALHMQANGGGAIVNVASTLGLQPAPLTAAYAASKAALISFTKSLAMEFGESQVRVNAVAPGIIDTDMIRVARTPGADVEAQLEQLRGLHALKRLGAAEEVAQAVLYLIDATFVTGSVLTVDGGLSLG